jgi:hypothetical protein
MHSDSALGLDSPQINHVVKKTSQQYNKNLTASASPMGSNTIPSSANSYSDHNSSNSNGNDQDDMHSAILSLVNMSSSDSIYYNISSDHSTPSSGGNNNSSIIINKHQYKEKEGASPPCLFPSVVAPRVPPKEPLLSNHRNSGSINLENLHITEASIAQAHRAREEGYTSDPREFLGSELAQLHHHHHPHSSDLHYRFHGEQLSSDEEEDDVFLPHLPIVKTTSTTPISISKPSSSKKKPPINGKNWFNTN